MRPVKQPVRNKAYYVVSETMANQVHSYTYSLSREQVLEPSYSQVLEIRVMLRLSLEEVLWGWLALMYGSRPMWP